MNKKTILLVDDDKSFRRVVEYQLQQQGYSVITADNGIKALNLFEENSIDLVISDLKMPDLDGFELLKRIKAVSNDSMIIILTAYGSVSSAVDCMRLGAFDYITKPVEQDEMIYKIERCLNVKNIINENRVLRQMISETFEFENMIGSSKAMTELYDIVKQVTSTDSTLLIQGESGTGKEVLAKAIHFNSPRKEEPFVVVNCGAIPEHLLESELFGYKRGAFTGAKDNKPGKFEAANKGTILLDEISELPLNLQVKILRVLQSMEIDKIGAVKPVKVDVRVIAATNKDLEDLIKKDMFREDLYYRLSVIPIILPTLKERKEDIPLLVNHFINKFSEKYGRQHINIDKEVFKIFNNYSWPGNIRELENLVHRLVVLSKSSSIDISDLPDYIRFSEEDPGQKYMGLTIPDDGIDLEEVQKELIRQALLKKSWNQTQAAKLLNISRNSLIYHMNKYELEREKS